jgi:5,10-methylenetetrahydromethanopterin reductase
MKLAVSLGHGLAPFEAVEATRKFEKHGFDFVWVSESVGYDALPILGAIATRTKKIGFGTGVVNVYSRTATQLAMAAATLEQMSPGRLALGVGASSRGVVSDWHGLEYTRQLQRVEEYVDTLKTRLRKERTRLPEPFASVRRDIPIVVAGVLDRMVSLSQQRADGVLFFMRRIQDVRKMCGSLSSKTFQVYANVVTCVSRDAAAAETRARKTVAYYLTYGDSYRRLIQLQDVDEESREAYSLIRSEWREGRTDEAARLVPQTLLQEVAIYGTPYECRRTIEEYSRVHGLHMLGLQFNSGDRDLAGSIELFSSLPNF